VAGIAGRAGWVFDCVLGGARVALALKI